MQIEFDCVTKHFGAVAALNDVSLRVGTGEVVALCGPNGAGKSTLLQLAIGLHQPTAGEVRTLGGDPVRNWQIKRQIGYAGGLEDLIGELTIDELLRSTGQLRGVRGGMDADAEELVEAFGLAAKRHEWIAHLSEGMRRKVAILNAMVGSPSLLMLDEPTSGLDLETQMLCRRVLARRAAAGATIVLGTHDFGLLDALGPRLVFLSAGRVIADGPLAMLMQQLGCASAEQLIVKLWPTGVFDVAA